MIMENRHEQLVGMMLTWYARICAHLDSDMGNLTLEQVIGLKESKKRLEAILKREGVKADMLESARCSLNIWVTRN